MHDTVMEVLVRQLVEVFVDQLVADLEAEDEEFFHLRAGGFFFAG
jgi:hypothetical protein